MSNIQSVFNAANREFKNIGNVRKIAIKQGVTPKAVIMKFCKQRLAHQDANRVSDLILNALP